MINPIVLSHVSLQVSFCSEVKASKNFGHFGLVSYLSIWNQLIMEFVRKFRWNKKITRLQDFINLASALTEPSSLKIKSLILCLWPMPFLFGLETNYYILKITQFGQRVTWSLSWWRQRANKIHMSTSCTWLSKQATSHVWSKPF